MMKNTKQRGITLMEVLIVVGVIGLLLSAGTVGLAKSRERAAINSESEKMLELVREVQNRSMSARAGKSWGLRCSDQAIFTYSPTDPDSIEEYFVMPTSFSCAVDTGDIRFEKLTGFPAVNQANLTLYYGGLEIKRIEVEYPGVINLINL